MVLDLVMQQRAAFLVVGSNVMLVRTIRPKAHRDRQLWSQPSKPSL